MHSTVLAAIDDSTAASAVLGAAESMASLLDVRLDAVHVRESGKQTARELARRSGIDVREVDGDPVTEILREAGDPAVDLVVVGARGRPTGPRPVGHIALAVVEHAAAPVLVVPPESDSLAPARPLRALVPLEGTHATSDAVADLLVDLCRCGVQVIVAHVFDAGTTPSFWGRQGHAAQSWSDAFSTRWCPEAPVTEVRLRRGVAPQTLLDLAASEHVDLIVLSWSQDLAPGRAAVVRSALTDSRVPVLLVPVEPNRDVRPFPSGGHGEKLSS